MVQPSSRIQLESIKSIPQQYCQNRILEQASINEILVSNPQQQPTDTNRIHCPLEQAGICPPNGGVASTSISILRPVFSCIGSSKLYTMELELNLVVLGLKQLIPKSEVYIRNSVSVSQAVNIKTKKSNTVQIIIQPSRKQDPIRQQIQDIFTTKYLSQSTS